jgi:hypothetical protein
MDLEPIIITGYFPVKLSPFQDGHDGNTSYSGRDTESKYKDNYISANRDTRKDIATGKKE